MPRPPRVFSQQILNTLTSRPRLRFTLTSKGVSAFEKGTGTNFELELDSLVAAIDANNKQPISILTWTRFHQPKKLKNTPIKSLIEDRLIRIVSRSKFSAAKQEQVESIADRRK